MIGSVWYVGYGSNLHAARLRYYLEGGTPPGGRRSCCGCRDPRRPERVVAHSMPGAVYFATESATWGGGRAFYDPSLPGTAACRAYLLTVGQFSDLAAQEMYRAPDGDLDLTTVLSAGRDVLGPGRYETLLHVGDLEGFPVLTFTAPWTADEVPWNPPSAVYLRMLGDGLRESHCWPPFRVAEYLCGLRGAEGFWSVDEVADLLAQ
ncbi:histone deacetylase [Amycolatopsis methanolica]|uniref:histone deacetylase n=1 Tax=Amycolatopsis methanolica TaxID=1814 RepID=UPI003425D6B5